MARLPQPGGDNGNWGDILNEYLSVSHGLDGVLADGSVGTDQLHDGAVNRDKLSSSVRQSLNKSDSALQNITNLLSAGSNITITGDGSDSSPYVINSQNSGGDVVGPASNSSNAIPRFSGTSGKTIQDSQVYVSNDGSMSVGNGSTAKFTVFGKPDNGNANNFIALFAENGISPEQSNVAGSASNRAVMVQGSGGAAYIGRDIANNIEFAMGVSSNGSAFAGSMTGQDFQLRTGNTTRVTIDTSGKVGMGTASPLTKLHLQSGNMTFGYTPNSRSLATFASSHSAGTTIAIISPDTAGSYSGIFMGSPSFETGGQIQYYPIDGYWRFLSTSSESFRFNSTGIAIGNPNGLQPTHSLTLPSTATGAAHYNTSDQTINYERFRQYWSGNAYYLTTESNGTGVGRNLSIGTPTRRFAIWDIPSNSGIFQFAVGTGVSNAAGVVLSGSPSQSSGSYAPLAINIAVNQSGSAGYTGMLMNITETSIGSGQQYLADFQVGGASKFSVDTNGKTISTGGIKSRTAALIPSSNSYTPNSATTDLAIISNPTANFTIANPSSTADDGQRLVIRIVSGVAAYTPSWGSAYMASGMTSLPTTSLPSSKTVTLSFVYDSSIAKWILLAADTVGY